MNVLRNHFRIEFELGRVKYGLCLLCFALKRVILGLPTGTLRTV